MKFNKITVITPVYNGETHLKKTIESVFSQGYPDLEFIVVDGGSQDGTLEIVNEFKDVKIISEPDNGMYHALSKGLKLASGEIICYINSDDILLPRSLFSMNKFFTDVPSAYLASGQPCFLDETDNLFVFSVNTPHKFSYFSFLNKHYKFIQQESTFFKKSILSNSICDGLMNCKLAGDFFLWLQLSRNYPIYFIPNLIGAFRLRPSGMQLSSDMNSYNEEAIEFIEIERSQNNSYFLRFVERLLRNFNFKIVRKIKIKFLKLAPEVGYSFELNKFILHDS